MSANISIPKNHGGIRTSNTRRGSTLQAWNHQRNQYVDIGTVSGATYEKVANVLKIVQGKYQPSFTLTTEELQTARDLGATFLRIINDGATYAISLGDFERYAVKCNNAFYGSQLACSLEYFAKTGQSKKRNAVLDNPKASPGTSMIFEKPQARQLPMFAPRFDEFGNYRG